MNAGQIAPNVWRVEDADPEHAYMAIWRCTSQQIVRFFTNVEAAKNFATNGRAESN